MSVCCRTDVVVMSLVANLSIHQVKFCLHECNSSCITSHSAYVATSTELHGVKIDGFL